MTKFFRKLRKTFLRKNKIGQYLKYAIGEIILVVIGILIAVGINNWNQSRKDRKVEFKTLREISSGLNQDLKDVKSNINGHRTGLDCIAFWRDIINHKKVDVDSTEYYYRFLTRDFLIAQNISGYETLKSKGLELIKDDSLRLEIITLYEISYSYIRKLEEEYNELQFQENYFKEINQLIVPNLIFDSDGEITSVKLPLNLNDMEAKKLQSYLWKIKYNRDFILEEYFQIEQKIKHLQSSIKRKMKDN
jgi:hypothetical protein